MTADFTVIQAVRHQFGDKAIPEGADYDAPFVGASTDVSFACPHVDPNQLALLQFESVGVEIGLGPFNYGYGDLEAPRNIIRINSVDIPGGITPGPRIKFGDKNYGIWKAHTLIVPSGLLRESENVLYIEAVHFEPFGGTLDHFIIDNVVITFKTLSKQTGSAGAVR